MNPYPDLAQVPERVVSLVPSMTRSLYDLGLGGSLVGITDFCQVPQGEARPLARIGGTRDPDTGRVLDLRPDLVMANQEENSAAAIGSLEKAGVPVWLAFPRSVADSIADLRWLAGIFGSRRALSQVDWLERAVEWRLSGSRPGPVRVFCPIWAEEGEGGSQWWMTFSGETYAGDVLRLCGGANVFELRRRRYPLAADLGRSPPEPARGRDERYPRVSAREIATIRPDLVLLPDEPFRFGEEEGARLLEALAAAGATHFPAIRSLEGKLLFWHGTYLGQSLRELPSLLGQEAAF